jgi:asparagine synthase (glutamine-hydrolysing)
MCGIAGFLGPGTLDDIRSMTDRIAHRGPDGEGLYKDPNLPVFLGHRRLAIVDLAHGEQPMWDADGEVGVVYNGEIYNHRELRRELECHGHRFLTDHSDTEVLVHGWKQWGRKLPEKLNGMFAFAVWDRRIRRIFLARDRFGEKPLYWAKSGGAFLFASELQAFRGHVRFAAEVDRLALAKYFALGFIPAPNALYRGCQKLPAGHWLELDACTGEIASRSYWRFSIGLAESPRNEDEAAEELRYLLSNATKIRLMSDVPLGVFLSGGIDSSVVAHFAAEAQPISTFTVGFHEKSFDESAYAARMATRLGSKHHEQILTITEAHALVPEVLARLDEPIADPSILPTYLLSRHTARHVKVALSGDGGDELFAGYDTFAAIGPARLYNRFVPANLHRGLVRLADLLPISGKNMSLDFKIRRALAGAAAPAPEWNPRWLGALAPEAVSELLQEKFTAEELFEEPIKAWEDAVSPDPMDRTLEFYTRFYLQDNILAKVDRASMMNGLETRAVFLDQHIAEFAQKVPARLKFRNGRRKYILKRAVEGLLPREILDRPKKGFGIPIKDWLREMPGPSPTPAVPDLNHELVRARSDAHVTGRADYRLFLWAWCVLQHHDPGRPRPLRRRSRKQGASRISDHPRRAQPEMSRQ